MSLPPFDLLLDGRTPLHIAAFKREEGVVRVLVEADANKEAVNKVQASFVRGRGGGGGREGAESGVRCEHGRKECDRVRARACMCAWVCADSRCSSFWYRFGFTTAMYDDNTATAFSFYFCCCCCYYYYTDTTSRRITRHSIRRR